MVIKSKKDSHIKAAAIGLILSLCMVCLCTGIFALMIHMDLLEEESSRYGTLIILLISVFTGNIESIRRVEQKRWMTCLLHACAVFVGLIVMSITLFGGPSGGVTATALVISGIAVASLMLFGKDKKTPSKHARSRRR